MLLLRRAALFRAPSLRPARSYTSSQSARGGTLSRRILLASGGVLSASALLGYGYSTIHADAHPKERERPPIPLVKLVKAYAVYAMCSIPFLVDYSPSILAFLTSIPGIRQITEAFVRVTFFDHFVGGDTAHACLPLLHQLRSENKGALFSYSVEVDENEAAGEARKAREPVHKRIVKEMVRCIDVAADFEDQFAPQATAAVGRRTWVAIKLSALLPNAEALHHFSSYLVKTQTPLSPPVPFPGCPRTTDLECLTTGKVKDRSPMTDQDIVDLKELYDDLVMICKHAQDRKVRIIIDAEYRYDFLNYAQPAIDSISLALMRQFNALPSRRSWAASSHAPLVYVTFQAYLRRTPEYLAQSLKDAKAGKYSLGVKLVRGAYHPQEVAAHHAVKSLSVSPDLHPPVWPTKTETDCCYNACAGLLIHAVQTPGVGVLFGSHNWASCQYILDELVKTRLAVRETEDGDDVVRIRDDVAERVTLAQLYGMSDALTNHLVDKTRSSAPFVIKYVPYGALEEVMPYLSRRAIENKSVLGNGQAAEERRQAWKQIWQRLFG
ncbi:FAD-linked oxidoreductase [Artomyces pyxidatus]|uniref:FAD-linked oxidoreductase n=1 Tax=Artomyces pyxidatus TaxID=48021 RepID=A0ACB8T327_9AGAM|nr:FAD-linked oxidoreductase [Artomyces pyxidatus]